MSRYTIGNTLWLVGLVGMLVFLLNNFLHIFEMDRMVRTIVVAVFALISISGAFIKKGAQK